MFSRRRGPSGETERERAEREARERHERAQEVRRERRQGGDIDHNRGGVEDEHGQNYEQGEGPGGELAFDPRGYSRFAADDPDADWYQEDSLGYSRGAHQNEAEDDNQGSGAWTQPPPMGDRGRGQWAQGPGRGQGQGQGRGQGQQAIDQRRFGSARAPAGGTAGYGAWPGGRTDQSGRQPGPHAGKGPKGYQRPDSRILEDVCERLSGHPHLDASQMDVTVEGGVVRLSGQVSERWAKHTAEDVALEVPGVKDVENQLRVARAR